jgi:hypothetical protein
MRWLLGIAATVTVVVGLGALYGAYQLIFPSASKSLILREKTAFQVFSRDFRGLAAVVARVAH